MAGLPASIAQIVRAGLSADRDELHTAMPAEVVAYDPLTETAFVKPLLKHALYTREGERVFEDYPEIPFVPVIFPSGGGMTIRLPVAAGDTVLLIFSESSMAEWRSTGQASAQEDARRHSLGWPIAIPGLFPDTKIRPSLDAAECAAGGMVVGDENSPAKMFVGGTIPGFRFGQLAVSPIALAVPLMAYVTAAVAAGTAGGASDTAVNSALVAIQAALTALMSVPANSTAAATQVTAAGTAVTAATTATAASTAAAAAAAAAATTAAGAVPSTLVKSL